MKWKLKGGISNTRIGSDDEKPCLRLFCFEMNQSASLNWVKELLGIVFNRSSKAFETWKLSMKSASILKRSANWNKIWAGCLTSPSIVIILSYTKQKQRKEFSLQTYRGIINYLIVYSFYFKRQVWNENWEGRRTFLSSAIKKYPRGITMEILMTCFAFYPNFRELRTSFNSFTFQPSASDWPISSISVSPLPFQLSFRGHRSEFFKD